MTTPYSVVIENLGCPHCSRGRTWTVLGPDGIASSTSYEDEEAAQDHADICNAAYEKGMAAAVLRIQEELDAATPNR